MQSAEVIAAATKVAHLDVDVVLPLPGQVTTQRKQVFIAIPTVTDVGNIAPLMLFQVTPPSVEDCHWYVIPAPIEVPVRLSVIGVVTPADSGLTFVVPATGVDEHEAAPHPFNGILNGVGCPPPVITILPG